MNELLEDHGKQLLRYKGVLNIAGEDRRMVFQGVLKLYGFDWDTEWAEGEARESVIVFIADDLPEEKIREGFAKVAAPNGSCCQGCRHREQARSHRFWVAVNAITLWACPATILATMLDGWSSSACSR
jgi:hypothetical protein